ncbi:MAG: hypothetical protein ACK4YP_16990, partial [Myxococcota bacterium]
PTLVTIIVRTPAQQRALAARAARALQAMGPAPFADGLTAIRKQAWQVTDLATLAIYVDPVPADVVDWLVAAGRRDTKERVVYALTALRTPRPKVFEALATDVLTRDGSAVAVDVVRAWAHRRAQHLLGAALGAAPVHGRWATGRTSWLFLFGSGQFRWTPAQQETWAQHAVEEVANPDRDTPGRLALMDELAELGWLAESPLHALAGDPTPVLRERGTRLLGRVDEGKGVPTLLTCLGDDRARWAIYALRRGLASVSADTAATLLLQAPRRQVTVAKEVVRLLGTLRGEAGYRALVGLSGTPLHRDVRIALLRALWDHLEREETWTVYEAAATGPDHVLASRLGDVPADRLTETSDRRLSALYARVIARPEPEGRIEALRRAPGLALRDRDRALFAACLARLDSLYVDEIAAAVEAVTRRLEEADQHAVAVAVPALAPNRRALGALLTRWRGHFPHQASRSLRAVFGAAVDALLPDPTLVSATLGDTFTVWGPAGFADRVEGVAERGHLHPTALRAARDAVDRADRPGAATLLRRWHASPDPSLRFLALGALLREAAAAGWSDDARAALATFQSDPDAMVAGEASWVLPPEELPASV